MGSACLGLWSGVRYVWSSVYRPSDTSFGDTLRLLEALQSLARMVEL